MTDCPTCQRPVGADGVCPDCGTTVSTAQQPPSSPGEQAAGDPRRSQAQRAGQSRAGRGSRGRPPLPTELKAVCGFLALSGVGSLWAGNGVREMSARAARFGASQGTAMETIGLVVMLLGLGQVVAAVGLWSRESWGWTATMGVTGVGTLSGLWFLMNGFTSTLGVIVLLSNAAVGWYVYKQRWRYRDVSSVRARRQTASRTSSQNGRNN